MADIKAIMNFLGSKINDTDSEEEIKLYQELMVDLSAKFNVAFKKMSNFHALTSKYYDYDIKSSLLKLGGETKGRM